MNTGMQKTFDRPKRLQRSKLYLKNPTGITKPSYKKHSKYSKDLQNAKEFHRLKRRHSRDPNNGKLSNEHPRNVKHSQGYNRY